MATRAEAIQQKYEPRPDPQSLTQNPDPSLSSASGVDYEPHPDQSIKVSPEREKIVKSITSLYSGSASEGDMQVYAQEAIYDDPWSYCDTRYKIAGQWYGMQLLHYSQLFLGPVAEVAFLSRNTQSDGLFQNPGDRNCLKYRHRDCIQDEAIVHSSCSALYEACE